MNAENKRILIIEDEEVMRTVLADKLAVAGFTVLKAKDGPIGLRMAQQEFPDLIVLDNRMPNMSGYEMLTRLRDKSDWADKVPVIFLSNVEPESRQEKLDISATGAAYYLIKSETSLDEVVGKVREILNV